MDEGLPKQKTNPNKPIFRLNLRGLKLPTAHQIRNSEALFRISLMCL